MSFESSRPARWLPMAAMLALACSCGKRDGNDANTPESAGDTGASSAIAVNVYSPQDAGAKAWGTFDFYGTHATLSTFQGHLTLEAAGRLPSSADKDWSGAQVYKITNAQEFHDNNQKLDHRCLAPARWLAIKPVNQSLRVGLLTLEAWQEFDPKKPGFCGAGMYQAG